MKNDGRADACRAFALSTSLEFKPITLLYYYSTFFEHLSKNNLISIPKICIYVLTDLKKKKKLMIDLCKETR